MEMMTSFAVLEVNHFILSLKYYNCVEEINFSNWCIVLQFF